MQNINTKFFEKRNKFRNYLHFDKKISDQKVFEYVVDKEKISVHSFFPMISYKLNDEKICRKNKKRIRTVTLKGKINKKKTKISKLDFKEKERLINFPSHIDGNIYAYYSYLLSLKYEDFLNNNDLSNNIIAFRKVYYKDASLKKISMCNIHFAKQVFDCINKKKNCSVLCLDISGFFDNLNHELLKKTWLEVIGESRLPKDHYQIFKSLTNFAYVNKEDLYKKLNLSLNSRTLHKRMDRLCDIQTFRNMVRKNKLIKRNLKVKGIPQGSPMSGMLSNIYMMNFDKNMKSKITEINGEYFRYCDDMIFIIDNENVDEIKSFILQEIDALKLNINDKKTQYIVFENGLVKKSGIPSFNYPHKLQYLGLLYDGQEIFLRETGLSKFHYKLRKAIRMRTAHYNRLQRANLHNNHNMYMRTLYTRFTYIGKRNYVSYAYRVAGEFDSNNIKRQIKGHFNIFTNYLEKWK